MNICDFETNSELIKNHINVNFTAIQIVPMGIRYLTIL